MTAPSAAGAADSSPRRRGRRRVPRPRSGRSGSGWRLGGARPLCGADAGTPRDADAARDRRRRGGGASPGARSAAIDRRRRPTRRRSQRGAIFENVETPDGPRAVVLRALRSGPARGAAGRVATRSPRWLFAPVAAELPEAWADASPAALASRSAGRGCCANSCPASPCATCRRRPRRSWRVPSSSSSAPTTWAGHDLPRVAGAALARRDARPDARRGAAASSSSAETGGSAPCGASRPSARPPRDPTGAGDIFLAALVAAASQAARLAPDRASTPARSGSRQRWPRCPSRGSASTPSRTSQPFAAVSRANLRGRPRLSARRAQAPPSPRQVHLEAADRAAERSRAGARAAPRARPRRAPPRVAQPVLVDLRHLDPRRAAPRPPPSRRRSATRRAPRRGATASAGSAPARPGAVRRRHRVRSPRDGSIRAGTRAPKTPPSSTWELAAAAERRAMRRVTAVAADAAATRAPRHSRRARRSDGPRADTPGQAARSPAGR